MAPPYTITNARAPIDGPRGNGQSALGPFVASDGDVFFITSFVDGAFTDATTFIGAWRSSDPSTTGFTEVDTGNRPGGNNPITHVVAKQNGDTIDVVAFRENGDSAIFVIFDMSAETWGTETSVNSAGGKNSGRSTLDIHREDANNIYVLFGGDDKNMGADYARVKWLKSTDNGATWGSKTNVFGAATDESHYTNGVFARGTGNNLHILGTDEATNSILSRVLDVSTDGLSTERDTGHDYSTSVHHPICQVVQGYSQSGTTVIRAMFLDDVDDVQALEFDSAADPTTFTVSEISANGLATDTHNSITTPAGNLSLNGETLHALTVNVSDGDLYSSDDGGNDTWTTPNNERAGTIKFVSGGILDHGGGDVLAFLVTDGTSVVYGEVSLAAAAATGEAAQNLQELTQRGESALVPEGIGASTIGAPSQSATGAEVFTGTGAQSIAAPTQAGSGLMHPDGAGDQTLAAVAQSADAVQKTSGDGASVLAELAQAGAGLEVFTATGASTVQIVAQAGDGVMHPEGTGASILAALAQAGSGQQLETATGTGAQTVSTPSQSGAGVETIAGTADQSLATLAQAGSGTETIAGSADSALAALAQAGIGVEAITATGAQSVASVTQSASGVMQPEGQGDLTLAALAQAGAGIETIIATAAQSLAELAQAGTGAHSENITATGASALASVEQAGTGVGGAVGDAEQTIAALAQAGIGVEAMEVTGAQALQQASQAGAGAHVEETAGAGAQSLASPGQAATGAEIVSGAASQTLANVAQEGAGLEVSIGTGDQLLAGLAQGGVGIEIFAGTGAQSLAALSQAATGLRIVPFPDDTPGARIVTPSLRDRAAEASAFSRIVTPALRNRTVTPGGSS